jgi:thymidylate kinase
MEVQARRFHFQVYLFAKIIYRSDRESSSGKTINEYLMNKSFKMSDEEIHELFALNRREMKDEMITLLA